MGNSFDMGTFVISSCLGTSRSHFCTCENSVTPASPFLTHFEMSRVGKGYNFASLVSLLVVEPSPQRVSGASDPFDISNSFYFTSNNEKGKLFEEMKNNIVMTTRRHLPVPNILFIG